jgi:hypothetical protein
MSECTSSTRISLNKQVAHVAVRVRVMVLQCLVMVI